MSELMGAAREAKGFAGDINRISSSLERLGIDATALKVTSAAFQAIGGTGQVIRGIISAKEAYNAYRLAEGTANVAKWGPFAVGVGAAAVAGGILMGEMIERHIRTADDGQGMRGLAGGYTNVR